MRLTAHGLRADLPRGWEGAIRGERQNLPPAAMEALEQRTGGPVAQVLPVAHFATFALPAERDDFGAQAVVKMGPTDAFISLLEYGAEEANTPLFANQGLPRRLDPRAFSPRQLQRTLPGQAGFQWFFTQHGRAFCLYVVLGDAGDAHRLVRRVEQVLARLEIKERR